MNAKEVKELISQNEYAKFLQLELIELKEGYAIGKIPFKSNVANPYQSMHGGVLYSLADIVAGCAACAFGSNVTTINGNLSYVRPALNTQYVTCEAKVIKQGKQVAFYQVDLFNDDHEVVASGNFQFYVM